LIEKRIPWAIGTTRCGTLFGELLLKLVLVQGDEPNFLGLAAFFHSQRLANHGELRADLPRLHTFRAGPADDVGQHRAAAGMAIALVVLLELAIQSLPRPSVPGRVLSLGASLYPNFQLGARRGRHGDH
jgi:hypothetical protein